MKTIVTFNEHLTALLKANYDLERVLRACQGEMNNPEKVQISEGQAKRGDVRGGQSRKADGTLAIKDMTWTERLNLDYAAKYTVPIEFVKFNDSLALHFKKCGQPSGELALGIIPTHLKDWLEANFQKQADAKPSADAIRKNGGVKSHKAEVPA